MGRGLEVIGLRGLTNSKGLSNDFIMDESCYGWCHDGPAEYCWLYGMATQIRVHAPSTMVRWPQVGLEADLAQTWRPNNRVPPLTVTHIRFYREQIWLSWRNGRRTDRDVMQLHKGGFFAFGGSSETASAVCFDFRNKSTNLLDWYNGIRKLVLKMLWWFQRKMWEKTVKKVCGQYFVIDIDRPGYINSH